MLQPWASLHILCFARRRSQRQKHSLATNLQRARRAVFEMKVEVLWGRAYLASLLVDDHGGGTGEFGPFKLAARGEFGSSHMPFNRACNGAEREPRAHRLAHLGCCAPRLAARLATVLRGTGEGRERPYNASEPSRAFHTGLEYASHRWIFDEGHMPCVWALAERVARRMSAEQVRVDIFLAKGEPARCVVNEISLSSGSPMGADERYAAMAWVKPLVEGTFKTLSGDLPPVYACEGDGCLSTVEQAHV